MGLLDDGLCDDTLTLVLSCLANDADIRSLVAVACASRQLSVLASAALPCAWETLKSCITAMDDEHEPTPHELMICQQASAALLHGALPPELSEEPLLLLSDVAIRAAEVTRQEGAKWILSACLPGEDESNDLSFECRGLDNTPLALRPDVLDWYTQHMPHRQLRRHHLPCVLAGPPRYLALAGSERQRRQARLIPLELCRVVREPPLMCTFAGGGTGVRCTKSGALLAALLRGSRQMEGDDTPVDTPCMHPYR